MIAFEYLTPIQQVQAVEFFSRMGLTHADAKDALYADPSTRVVQLADIDRVAMRACVQCNGVERYRSRVCSRCSGLGQEPAANNIWNEAARAV